jgi:hypothetical protein
VDPYFCPIFWKFISVLSPSQNMYLILFLDSGGSEFWLPVSVVFVGDLMSCMELSLDVL